MDNSLEAIMAELESLGKDRTKKNYLSQGAREPLFGVATGAMKPIQKRTGKNQELAESLYATGNYDAMYFAGVIAEPGMMTKADYNRWMESAYFYMLSDYVVAVTLSESSIAQEVADEWIASGEELYMSAGWSCYEWLIGSRKDSEFDRDKILSMLKQAGETIHSQPNRCRNAMNNFVIAVGVSYLPLHDEALSIAKEIGSVEVFRGKSACKTPVAAEAIQTAADKGRLGFKRKNVRC